MTLTLFRLIEDSVDMNESKRKLIVLIHRRPLGHYQFATKNAIDRTELLCRLLDKSLMHLRLVDLRNIQSLTLFPANLHLTKVIPCV